MLHQHKISISMLIYALLFVTGAPCRWGFIQLGQSVYRFTKELRKLVYTVN